MFLRSLEKFITNIEKSEQFLKQNAFLTCSWRFLKTNTLEQLQFKLEKNNWELETYRKSLKMMIFVVTIYFLFVFLKIFLIEANNVRIYQNKI